MKEAISSAIDDIREDKTYLITHGYIVLCFLGIIVGALTIWTGDTAIGMGIVVTSLIGLETWTGWAEMMWRDYRRAH